VSATATGEGGGRPTPTTVWLWAPGEVSLGLSPGSRCTMAVTAASLMTKRRQTRAAAALGARL